MLIQKYLPTLRMSLFPKGRIKRQYSIWLFACLLVILASGTLYMQVQYKDIPLSRALVMSRTEYNYGDELALEAEAFDLPVNYLKALTMLESSGKREAHGRFEKHVFEKLQEVREGKTQRYGKVETKQLSGKADKELRLLATSWGPFQLMGYHTLELGVPVTAISEGDSTVFWGTKWINIRYGDKLRSGDYKNAFHLHNTGRPHPEGDPLTYDPEYINKGVTYMMYFELIDEE